MATPMFAAFRAGASFTPSPVMATSSPRALSACTSFSFCSGTTRAKMLHVADALLELRLVHRLELGTGDHLSAGSSPICRAMARAVPG